MESSLTHTQKKKKKKKKSSLLELQKRFLDSTPQEYLTKLIFGLYKLKNMCPAAHTITLAHFGHVLELPRHSEYLFSDPNLDLLKLQDGLREF